MFTALAKIKHNGMAWTIRSEYLTPIMNKFVKKLDDVVVGDGVRIIKSNRVRTTLSAPFIDGQRVIIKRYHIKRRLKKGIKYLFRPSCAKTEWDMMKGLIDKGISTCVPLAYGEERQWGFLKDASLIIKEIPDCLTFQAYFVRHCSGKLSKDKILQKRALFRKLANFIQHIHKNNIDHRDFHGGNILVTETDSGSLEFYIIDLHKARFCRKLSLQRRVDNLADIIDTHGRRLSKTDCMRLIKYYGNFRDKKDFKVFTSKVLKRVKVRRYRRLKSRTRWCLKLSNLFTIYKEKGVKVYYRKEYRLADILDLFKKIENYPENAQGNVLKRSLKAKVFLEEITFNGNPKKIVVKHNFYRRNFFDMLKKTFLGTKGKRAWVAGNGLIARGIPTPQPIALIEKKSFGFTRDNFLLTEYVDDALCVNDYVSKYFNNKLNKRNPKMIKKKKLFIEKLARLFRSFHDTGFYHCDLSGVNVLVKEGQHEKGKMFIIDLDSVLIWRKLTLKRRLKNLSQINGRLNCITNTDRMRFFKTYFRGIPPNARKYIKEIMKHREIRRLRRVQREERSRRIQGA
ncbi:MAG: lipopolysaccharide kinase InaA family protein [Candidatus Brocadiales bacterium]